MTTQEIANRLVELCREGNYEQAQDELYADNARSIEMDQMGEDAAGIVEGMEAIKEKGRRWEQTFTEMHAAPCSDPLVAGKFFSVMMGFDATWKEGGRSTLEEICVYEVADGKIVCEQFFYTMPGEGS